MCADNQVVANRGMVLPASRGRGVGGHQTPESMQDSPHQRRLTR